MNQVNYLELNIELSQFDAPMGEVFIAELGEIDFESFIEEENVLKAYIPIGKYREHDWKEIVSNYGGFNYGVKEIEQLNWNAKWESNFEPILVDDYCYIRAPFHASRTDIKYEIEIEPKMSFGTGHHPTTRLVIQLMRDVIFDGKQVLDMGCGTGILAIMAHYQGAQAIRGIDIDEWAVDNSKENALRNGVSDIIFALGNASIIIDNYDIILANINRNILVNDMNTFASHLKTGGKIIFSGFYKSDINIIEDAAMQNKLRIIDSKAEGEWIALVFQKE